MRLALLMSAALFVAQISVASRGEADKAVAQATAGTSVRPSGGSASFLAEDGIPIAVPATCNSVVFAQLPGRTDYFLGRIGSNGGTCADAKRQWSIALFRMNWSAHRLEFLKEVLRPPIDIAVGQAAVPVRATFDPSVVYYHGEFWVAFECASVRIGGASACIG
ncbi:MAG TPA: hypothetical protein VHV77_09865, partial [Pirellulales bacterium]|nr:hypothetical protein [Pirellulales bacterium]